MTIHHTKDAKLHIREGDDWREVDLAKQMRDFVRGHSAEEDLAREVEQRMSTMRTLRAESDEYEKIKAMDKLISAQRVVVDYAPPGSDITMVLQIRGNKPTMMIIDEAFDDERMRQRMRVLDRVFVLGAGPYSTVPSGFFNSTTVPAGPRTPIPTYPQINSLLQALLSRLK